jgi:hypothetical protein
LGDQVANLFRERRLAVAGFTSSIAIATPKVFTVGKSGGWWQTNVIIPFDFVAI